MPWFTLIQDTCSILRAPTTVDAYMSTVYDWDAATVVASGRCSIQPGFSDEIPEDRQTVTTTWRLITDDSALFGLLATDRIQWEGRTFEVDSIAMLWRHYQQNHHIEANLREVQG
jgi:hypothetical protein